jgi:hypothetical protein
MQSTYLNAFWLLREDFNISIYVLFIAGSSHLHGRLLLAAIEVINFDRPTHRLILMN